MTPKKKATPKLPVITLLQAFEQITAIINDLKSGVTTANIASDFLTSLAGRINKDIPGVSFKMPSEADLKTIEKEPEYESSYNDSNCW